MELPPIRISVDHFRPSRSSETDESAVPQVKSPLMPEGSTHRALVRSISPVTAHEKQMLLARLEHTAPAQSPAAREGMIKLLSSPAVLLAELSVRGQNLFTITDRALVVGQALQVKVTPDGQLSFALINPQMPARGTPPPPLYPINDSGALTKANIDPLLGVISAAKIPPGDINSLSASAQPGVTVGPASGRGALPALSQPSAVSVKESAEPEKWTQSQRQMLETIAGAALRQALPKARPLMTLLNNIQQLRAALVNMPEAAQEKLLPETVRQNLAVIQQHADRTLALVPYLQKPSTAASVVQKLMQGSGAFLETQTARALAFHSDPAKASVSIDAGKLALPSSSSDLKAALVDTIELINQWTPPPAVSVTMQDDNGGLESLMAALLANFLGRSAPQASGREKGPQKLLEAIRQQLEFSLARVQMQQLQNVSHKLHDSGYVNLQLDIPLRLPEGYGNLALHIQEKPYVEPEKRAKKQAKSSTHKKSRWQVFMEFELGEDGHLASELNVVENSVSALFWADNPSLRTRAQKHLNQLKTTLTETGLEVEDILCSQSPPPARPVKLNYSLIDITT